MKNRILIAVIAALGTFSAGIFAATQGSVDETGSTGTLDITLTVDPLVMVSGLSDITLQTVNDDDLQGVVNTVCVYSNTSSGYLVTASSANETGTTFRLKDGGTNYIPYTVTWNDDNDDLALDEGVQSEAQTNANSTTTDCSSGDGSNASITVDVTGANILLVPSGTYTDTLTIIVAPPS